MNIWVVYFCFANITGFDISHFVSFFPSTTQECQIECHKNWQKKCQI